MTQRTSNSVLDLRYLTEQSVFWVVSYLILLRVLDQDGNTEPIDHIYTLFFHLHLVVVVLANAELLIPRLFSRQRYTTWILANIANLSIALVLYRFTFNQLTDWLLEDYYFVVVFETWETLLILLAYLTLSTLLTLSKSWFKNLELERKLAKSEQARLENELKLLRAQISPHFLFNSLNTIYGLSLKKDEMTPALVLALSDILRYSIETGNRTLIPISEETNMLNQYLEVQRHRLENKETIQTQMHLEDETVQIPSLLLIELAENAFKHGNLNRDGAYFNINIQSSSAVTRVVFRNSADLEKVPKTGTKTGLSNLQRRLSLLFDNKHSFKAGIKNNEFMVEVEITHG